MNEEEGPREKVETRVTREAGRVLAREAWRRIEAAIEGFAEDFLGFAEKELEAARKAREGRPVEQPEETRRVETGADPSAPASQPANPASDPKVEKEARARAELEAIKAAIARGEALPAPSAVKGEPPALTPFQRERREREERARKELEELKRRLAAKEDVPGQEHDELPPKSL